jgi:hypothetical protein
VSTVDQGGVATKSQTEQRCATCGTRVERGDFFYRCRQEAEVAVLFDPIAYLFGDLEKHRDGSVTLDVCIPCYMQMDTQFGSRQRHQKT